MSPNKKYEEVLKWTFSYIKKFNASIIKPKSKVYGRLLINALLKEPLIGIDDLLANQTS